MKGVVRTLAFTAWLVGCAQSAPEGTRVLRIGAPEGHFAREGFVEMVSPIHLPTTAGRLLRTRVFLKLPPGGRVATDGTPQAPTLRFPPGTEAERVDEWRGASGWRVVDVRGTRLDEGGRALFHAYRPARDGGPVPRG